MKGVPARRRLEIAALKAEARALRWKIIQRSDLPCGAHIANMLRPDIAAAEARFDEIMDRLREIDPKCPLR